MPTLRFPPWGRLAILLLGAVGQAAMAGPAGDPLQRPARASARAATSMMTAVARAGDALVAVGERGLILRSADSGRHWVQARVPVSVLLTGVRFATPRRGWAVGHSGTVLATSDGGMSWTVQLDGARAARLVQRAAGQAGGDGAPAVRLRADAARLVREGADKPFFDLDVESEQVVTAVGAFGLAMRSEDGGASWRSWGQRIPNPGGSHLYAAARSGDAVVFVGEQGLVCAAVLPRTGCAVQAVPAKSSNFGVVVLSERHWLVYGLRGKAQVTDDGGDSWRGVSIDEAASLTAGLRRNDGSVVLASQAGTLFVSTDGGRRFEKLPRPDPVPIVGMAEAPDGALVVAGLRGVARIEVKVN